MVLYIIVGCVVLALLGTGIPIFFIFRNSSRESKASLEKAMHRAGDETIVIAGAEACLDPTSPKRTYGCALLTDAKLIYVGHDGEEIVVPRTTIAKIEVATPILGSEEHGDTLLVSHSGDSELLRISVGDGKRWMHMLGPEASASA